MLKPHLVLLMPVLLVVSARAQQTQPLPSAPAVQAQLIAEAHVGQMPVGSANTAPQATAGQATSLTRRAAEQMAVRNNPRISVANLLALAQKQVQRETRAGLLPTLTGNVTGVVAEQGSRLSSGTLAASRMLDHVGAGVELEQLITDFGHTSNLLASSTLAARAANASAQATQQEIELAADLAFYGALEAQATERVALSTIEARQAVRDQVAALTSSKLKSLLDQSFAEVNLSEAKLLELDARNQVDAAMAQLNEVLGSDKDSQWSLVDEDQPPMANLPPTVDGLITLAFQQRPDLQQLSLTHQADVKFSKAERDQLFPTVSGMGTLGATPVGSSQYFNSNWYGAAGVNIQVPVFDGFRIVAQASEANLRARASDEKTRDLHDRIARDVRTAYLSSLTAHERMAVTHQLVDQANMALDLAQTRYKLGLSSIVELSQAQLQQTQAQIEDANARFTWEADLASLRFQTGSQP